MKIETSRFGVNVSGHGSLDIHANALQMGAGGRLGILRGSPWGGCSRYCLAAPLIRLEKISYDHKRPL